MSRNNLVLAILMVIITISFAQLQVDGAGTAFLEADVVENTNGKSVNLAYKIDNLEDVSGAQFKLVYDKTKLEYIDFLPGNVFTGIGKSNQYFYIEPNENNNGELVFGVVMLNKVESVSNGDLIKLIFDVLPGKSGDVVFKANDALVIDSKTNILFEDEPSLTVNLESGANDLDGDGVADENDLCDDRNIIKNVDNYEINEVGCPVIVYEESNFNQLKNLDNSNLREIENFFVGNSKYGMIQFIDTVDLIDNNGNLIDLNEAVMIRNGVVSVEDSRLKGKRGTITIKIDRVLDLEKIVVFRDGIKCDNDLCRVINKNNFDSDGDSIVDSTSIGFEVSSL